MNSPIFLFSKNLMMVPPNQSGEKLMTALLKPNLVKTEELSKLNKKHKMLLIS